MRIKLFDYFSNVRVMVRELLTFLEKADKEFKQVITSEVCRAAEKFLSLLFFPFPLFCLIRILGMLPISDGILTPSIVCCAWYLSLISLFAKRN